MGARARWRGARAFAGLHAQGLAQQTEHARELMCTAAYAQTRAKRDDAINKVDV